MMEWRVIAHEHDADAGIYRLVIGGFDTMQLPVDSAPDGNGKTVEVVEYQVTEEDFLFAADDPQWEGMEPEAVAAKQRDIVRGVLEERDAAVRKEERRRRKSVTGLPGVGDSL